MEILCFTMSNCPPAKLMEEALTALMPELIADLKPELKLLKLDVEHNRELADQFTITAIPTIVVLRKDHEKGRILGYYPQDELKTKIKTMLSV